LEDELPAEQAYWVALLQAPLTTQAAFAFVQLVALVHHPLQRQAQVEFHPHEPATLEDEVPAEQAYWVALSHEPLTTQAAFALEQLKVLVHHPLPRQAQVEFHPQEPATLEDELPAEQAYWVALLQAPLTTHAAFAFAQLKVLVHPPLQRHAQVEFHPQEPATLEDEVPAEQAYWVALLQDPLTAQAAFAIPQAILDPPPLPRHVQDEEPPHEPAEYPEGEPAEQVLLDPPHDPFTEQAAFAFEQLKVLVPPPLPRHAQVEFHPQEPATLEDEVPAEQAYWVALLQAPLTAQAAFAFEQVVSFVHPPEPRQDQVEFHPQEPATLEDELPAEQAYWVALLQEPFTRTGHVPHCGCLGTLLTNQAFPNISKLAGLDPIRVTHQLEIFWLNAEAVSNIHPIFVTLAVLKVERGLLKAVSW
jgi:hypothetical protein